MRRVEPELRRSPSVFIVVLGAVISLLFTAIPASAITFTYSADGSVAEPSSDACPTLKSAPEPFETWFNIDDMQVRGYADPGNQKAWSFHEKTAQIICGAAQGATITIGMFFLRALGTMTDDGQLGDRPESDPEVIYKALEYVHNQRGVTIGIVLGSTGTKDQKADVLKRLKGIATVAWCRLGCFNLNPAKVNSGATNHEKFMTISNTIWAGDGKVHPIVYSSSGNWARSQTRGYWQEESVVYDDDVLFQETADRYTAMAVCASASDCKSDSKFPQSVKNATSKQHNIWVDTIGKHYTEQDRGTSIAWAPAPRTMTNFYVAQFNNVDCTVDNQVRIAMFRLTDVMADKMVSALKGLKSRGCDVKMVLSAPVASYSVSKSLRKKLKSAKLWYACARYPLHTKLILIGPSTSNGGRILFGTANFSSAMVWNEEHTITLDARRATSQYAEQIRRVYGEYMGGWYEIAKGSKRDC